MRTALLVMLIAFGAIWTIFIFGLWATVAVGLDVFRWLLSSDYSVPPGAGGVASFAIWVWSTILFVVWAIGAAVLGLIAIAARRLRGEAVEFRRTTFRADSWSPGGRPMKDVTPDRPPGSIR